MKINQLFTRKVDTEVLAKLLSCFGIANLNDKRYFCKHDMVHTQTVERLKAIKHELEEYYLPCKAKVYLDGTSLNEKRAVTILKQVLRLHGYYLSSKEKNVNSKKVIFYQLLNEKDRYQTNNMRRFDVTNIISFD